MGHVRLLEESHLGQAFPGLSQQLRPRPLFLHVHKQSLLVVEPFSFSFFDISGWGIDLDCSDTE